MAKKFIVKNESHVAFVWRGHIAEAIKDVERIPDCIVRSAIIGKFPRFFEENKERVRKWRASIYSFDDMISGELIRHSSGQVLGVEMFEPYEVDFEALVERFKSYSWDKKDHIGLGPFELDNDYSVKEIVDLMADTVTDNVSQKMESLEQEIDKYSKILQEPE